MLASEGAVCINELKAEEHASHSRILFYTGTLFLCFIAKMLYPYCSLILLHRVSLCSEMLPSSNEHPPSRSLIKFLKANKMQSMVVRVSFPIYQSTRQTNVWCSDQSYVLQNANNSFLHLAALTKTPGCFILSAATIRCCGCSEN